MVLCPEEEENLLERPIVGGVVRRKSHEVMLNAFYTDTDSI